jgi:hypothetical protein
MEVVSRQFRLFVPTRLYLNTILKAFEGAGIGFIKISYEFEGSLATVGAFAV